MALELRPAHNPTKKYGFVGVVVSVEDLSASVWLWHRGRRRLGRAEGDHDPGGARGPRLICRPLLQPFGAVPPLVTDIDLSVDDQLLYVSCWGTGELKQYDCQTRSTRGRPDQCESAASSAASRTRRDRTCR